MHVLFAAAEAVPFVKVGGLADVAGSLPQALASLGTFGDAPGLISLAIPFHPVIDRSSLDLDPKVINLSVPHPERSFPARVYTTRSGTIPVYLIEGEPISSQRTVYSLDTRIDGGKYTFFSLAVLELCKVLHPAVDILHAHDWHTGISVHMLRILRKHIARLRDVKSVFTVHNLPYMGAGIDDTLLDYGIPLSADRRLPPWGANQPLPMALSAADAITTVSPGYAREITTPEFGCGLENFLKSRAEDMHGILNGLDLEEYNPQTDPELVSRFSLATLQERGINKQALQTEFGFPTHPEIPLITLVSRFDFQKGIDLAVRALETLAETEPFQAILLGSGNPEIETSARALETQYPDRIRAVIAFNPGLSRRLFSGGDILLIPSRYEPGGLTQMMAMRYGCIPVARSTGGLGDTIHDHPDLTKADGFLFEPATPDGLIGALQRVFTAFRQPEVWTALQTNAMRRDFSWAASARKYAQIYQSVMRD